MRKQRLLNDIQKYWHLTYQSLQAFGDLILKRLRMVERPKWSHFIKT